MKREAYLMKRVVVFGLMLALTGGGVSLAGELDDHVKAMRLEEQLRRTLERQQTVVRHYEEMLQRAQTAAAFRFSQSSLSGPAAGPWKISSQLNDPYGLLRAKLEQQQMELRGYTEKMHSMEAKMREIAEPPPRLFRMMLAPFSLLPFRARTPDPQQMMWRLLEQQQQALQRYADVIGTQEARLRERAQPSLNSLPASPFSPLLRETQRLKLFQDVMDRQRMILQQYADSVRRVEAARQASRLRMRQGFPRTP